MELVMANPPYRTKERVPRPPAHQRALTTELTVACKLARAAGTKIRQLYGLAPAENREGGPVTAADRASNEVIVRGLRDAFPSDAILSEESADSEDRLTQERVWIVDPLDGTKEFLLQNGEFAVMIGLAIHGEAVVGAVYMPIPDILFSAARGCGAWIDERSERRRLVCKPPVNARLRMVRSRSHPDALLTMIEQALGVTDHLDCGSVGVKCGLIAIGDRDLYVHPVPHLKEWDTCAPDIVLQEAGGQVVDCLGSKLRYNKPKPNQPHGIVAATQGVLEIFGGAIRDVYARSGNEQKDLEIPQ
jgi:3'(2'), 5'-bisphosphate nucleotidase